LHVILYDIKKNEIGGACGPYGGTLRRKHLEYLGIDGEIILEWFKLWDGVWTGLIWLRIGTGGGLLSNR
jgi:hypothetical protein